MKPGMVRSALAAAIVTIGALFGGIFLGAALSMVIFPLLPPGHDGKTIALVFMQSLLLGSLVGMTLGGAVWGIWIGRLAESYETKRMALAGSLGFAPITIFLGILLRMSEPGVAEALASELAIHRIFTLYFVPTAFLIAGISALAVGLGLRKRWLALNLFWQVGFAAAISFLIVNMVMERSGWVVGAFGADERFTMLSVMLLGDLAAAAVGGAILGVRVIPQMNLQPYAVELQSR